MYDFEVDVVNVKLITKLGVDVMSSELIYEYDIDIDVMRLKCNCLPILQRSRVLKMLLGSTATLAFTFCQGKMSTHASLLTLNTKNKGRR